METKIWNITSWSADPNQQLNEEEEKILLQHAVPLLSKGELVAFPTETVYGLGANALDANAVQKIFQAKGRPSDNPLIVHVDSLEMLRTLVAEDSFPKEGSIEHTLCKNFWPGPLTILFNKSSKVPDIVTAGLEKVAVRMPKHPVAYKLIHLSGLPIAAPSANISGNPSPTTASHVFADLNGRVACILDGGPAEVGVESTVVDLNSKPPLILRPGGVTLEQLRIFVPNIQVYEKSIHGSHMESKPPTPGLKYKHYSPKAVVVLFEDCEDKLKLKEAICKSVREAAFDQKKSLGIIHTQSKLQYPQDIIENSFQFSFHNKEENQVAMNKNSSQKIVFYDLGNETKPAQVAHGIFAALRDLDMLKLDLILVEGISENEEGLAVMNRLRKAASQILNLAH